MDDILFVALFEGAVEYVDERWGRTAAWFTGAALLAVPVALLVGAVWRFTTGT